jgi:hypothetical protein
MTLKIYPVVLELVRRLAPRLVDPHLALSPLFPGPRMENRAPHKTLCNRAAPEQPTPTIPLTYPKAASAAAAGAA